MNRKMIKQMANFDIIIPSKSLLIQPCSLAESFRKLIHKDTESAFKIYSVICKRDFGSLQYDDHVSMKERLLMDPDKFRNEITKTWEIYSKNQWTIPPFLFLETLKVFIEWDDYNSARYLVDQMLLLPEKKISGQLYYSVLRIFAESCNTKFAFQGLTIWEQLKKKNPEFGHFLIAMELLVVQKKFFELQKVYQEAIEKFKNTDPLERRFLHCSLKILRNYLQEKDLENSRLIFNQLIKLNCKIPPDIYFSIIMIHADTAGVHSFYNGTKLWLQIKDYENNSKNLPFMAVMEMYGKHGDLYNLEKLFQSLSSNANVSKYCIEINYIVGLMDAKEPEKVKNAYYSYFKSFLELKEEKALRLSDRLLEISFDTKDLEWAKHIFMNIKNSASIPNMSIYERYIKNMCLLGQKEHAKQVLEEILLRDWRSEGLDIERLEKYIYRV